MTRRLPDWVVVASLALVGPTAGCTGVVGGDPKIEAPVHEVRAHATPVANVAGAGGGSEVVTVCDRLVDDFSQEKVGSFPSAWETRFDSNRPLAERQFQVVEVNGRRALKASYREQVVTLGRGVDGWSLKEYPILAWEWRASKLPAGANESESSRDDSAASVTAVWLIGFPFMVRQLEYVWSSSLAVGTRTSNRLGHDQLVVLQAGRANGWQRERVNLLEHAQRFFGQEPDEVKAPTGIALITDADDTQSEAEAYYTNFRLCRLAAASKQEKNP